MSFLERASKGEDVSTGSDQEELYMRLFPKIGRDFVHKEDLNSFLQQIIHIIDPFGTMGLSVVSDINARRKALEYKTLLDSGQDLSNKYKDLIDMEE